MDYIHVCAAVIVEGDEVLLATRPHGRSMAGLWEFPGGKIDPGESFAECLVREIHEEIGIDIIVLDRLYTVYHSYPDKNVALYFFRCARKDKKQVPQPKEEQEIMRIKFSHIEPTQMLPADISFIDYLKKYSFF